MFISTFDIFKIGVGPSSSHTMGPMIAASMFMSKLNDKEAIIPGAVEVSSLKCQLYGSLALTGKGHQTDKAIILGLAGISPATFEPVICKKIEKDVYLNSQIKFGNLKKLSFNPKKDIIFNYEHFFKQHPNAMTFQAFDINGQLYMTETYFSVGGGFVLSEKDFSKKNGDFKQRLVPFPFSNAAELLEMSRLTNKPISKLMLENELSCRTLKTFDKEINSIWETMDSSIECGLANEGILPGGLGVRRRARDIHKALKTEQSLNLVAPHIINDWISVYAMAVNEENANGGKVVTAPTNGAAGVIPATIRYYLDHVPDSSKNKLSEFLLTAAAIGSIIKSNASISGAEVGCQGEIGSASAMAAAGLCSVLGGSSEQIENAAEIALEHHLGMTCDPIKGLVQAPCIERNGLGAIKAVSSASLALRGNGFHLVSLDNCIKTMKETGRDMSSKYKETAMGGLAVNITDC